MGVLGVLGVCLGPARCIGLPARLVAALQLELSSLSESSSSSESWKSWLTFVGVAGRSGSSNSGLYTVAGSGRVSGWWWWCSYRYVLVGASGSGFLRESRAGR